MKDKRVLSEMVQWFWVGTFVVPCYAYMCCNNAVLICSRLFLGSIQLGVTFILGLVYTIVTLTAHLFAHQSCNSLSPRSSISCQHSLGMCMIIFNRVREGNGSATPMLLVPRVLQFKLVQYKEVFIFLSFKLSICQYAGVFITLSSVESFRKRLYKKRKKKKKKIEWLDSFWVPIIIDWQHSTLLHSCQIFAIENIFCFDLVMLQVIFSTKLIHTNQDKTNDC